MINDIKKGLQQTIIKFYIMFKNFFLESFRNKIHRPFSFIINWFGMTLGFAAVIVMYLYIVGELNHDKECFSSSMDRIYRCEMGDQDMGSICPSALQPFMTQMPEVKSATRIASVEQVTSTIGLSTNKKIKLGIVFADSTFMDIFPFKIITGDAATALQASDNVIISRSAAQKLYDTEDVVGKLLKLDNRYEATIVAVIEDVPENSSFRPEIIANNTMLCKIWEMSLKSLSNWGNWYSEVYIKLHDNVNLTDFEPKYRVAVKGEISRNWGNEYLSTISLRPFSDCYMAVMDGFSISKTTNPDDLLVLGFVALLILVIAIINYVNIYTARSTEVIHAMGIKSIMGAMRRELIGFVIFDSIVITLVSVVSGFLLAALLKPLYGLIIGSEVSFSLEWYSVAILFVGLPMICGLISGIFPALALTRTRPLDAMANRSSGGGRRMIMVRNILIICQFSITIILISTTLYINKQMKHMGEIELGYDRDNVYVVSGGVFMSPKFDAFRGLLLQNPNIKDVALMKNNPIAVDEFMTVSWGDKKDDNKTVNVMWNDEHALRLLGIEMVEGDSISASNVKNLKFRQMIINETFANELREKIPGLTFPYKDFIGVFKDFQSTHLYKGVTPLVIGSIWSMESLTPPGSGYIKIAAGSDLTETLKFIETTFQDIYPDEMYEASFMDEQFNSLYVKEQFFRTRLLTFSILAIFIGCLGLLALVSYSVERRRKEIAIRKVYGSTIGEVMSLLTIGFARLLLVSFVVAVPVSYYIMVSWVEQFAYRTAISWWIFAVALVTAMFIAALTVLRQTYRAAAENPAKSVKS